MSITKIEPGKMYRTNTSCNCWAKHLMVEELNEAVIEILKHEIKTLKLENELLKKKLLGRKSFNEAMKKEIDEMLDRIREEATK